jgi:hypothetical protein
MLTPSDSIKSGTIHQSIWECIQEKLHHQFDKLSNTWKQADPFHSRGKHGHMKMRDNMHHAERWDEARCSIREQPVFDMQMRAQLFQSFSKPVDAT